jgi:hypothetical protein
MTQVQAENIPEAAITIFKQAMQNAGIEPLAEIIADNVLHRFAGLIGF